MVIVLIANEYDASGALPRKQVLEFDDLAGTGLNGGS